MKKPVGFSCSPVNRELLPLKAHFFLYLSAQACVYTYLTVIGRQNGISASVIALIFGVTPLAAVVVKPACGFVIDRTQNATAVILVLQAILIVAHAGVFFSPSIRDQTWSTDGVLDCSRGTVALAEQCPEMCFGNLKNVGRVSLRCNVSVSTSECGNLTSRSVYEVDSGNASQASAVIGGHEKVLGIGNSTVTVRCPCGRGLVRNGDFWIYTVSVVIAWVTTATLFTVTDAAVCEVLGDNVSAFGRQRLWGTVGWGILSPIVGISIDKASAYRSGGTDYRPGFYAFAAIMLLDMILIACMPRLRTAALSKNIFRDVKSLFNSVEVVMFTFWTFMMGALLGVIWSYSTWFLEDVGASKLIIGCASAVLTMVEFPLFFASRNILNKIGYFLSYSIAFALMAGKFISYSFLQNPWYGVLVELIGGAIFPIFYASVTVFSKTASKPGTSASMICILGATYEGLGIAAGNAIGGVGFDSVGGRSAFRYLGYSSLVFAVCCTLSHYVIKKKKSGSFGSQAPILTESSAKRTSPPHQKEVYVNGACCVDHL